MFRKIVLRIVILALISSATLMAQAPDLSPAVREFVSVDAPVVALTHVRLIDGKGTPAVEDQTIVIVDGQIRAMGDTANTPVPDNAEILDLEGRTVIPGIVGMHEHLFYPAGSNPPLYPTLGVTFPRLYLANGVTTMRTGGSMEPYLDQNIKRRIDSGRMVGPKMHLTAPYLEGQGSPILQLHQLSGPEEARQMVNYWADLGFTSFKAYNYISRAELRAAVDEAHKRGLKVTGHLCSVGFGEAAEIGIDNLEHGWRTNTEFTPGKQPDQCPPGGRTGQALASLDIESPEAQETIRNLVQHGVAITSTLVVNEASMPGRPMMSRRALDTMSAEAQANFFGRRARSAVNLNAISVVLFRKEMEFQYAFSQAGGLLVAGVDPTGNGGALPGFGDLRNIELLVEAGFSTEEAIQISTSNGAQLLGESDRIGTLSPGMAADLVVIRGNPAADVSDILNVETVFKDGIGYDSEKLIDSVRGSVGG
jgi:imidazolonepropionase-like amidohydrolase